MFGKNAITKPEYIPCNQLKVNSIFSTIQGEGPYSGEPALFVRLTGCNLRCEFCDTEFEKGAYLQLPDLVKIIQDQAPSFMTNGFPLVVITGGEPFLQPDLPALCTQLVDLGFKVQIETAGTVWQSAFGELFTSAEGPFYTDRISIVCSPKTGKLNKDLAYWIHSYKYVIRNGQISETDGLSTERPGTGKKGDVARFYDYNSFFGGSDGCKSIFVMPCDEHDEELNKQNLQTVQEISQKYGYRVCLQLHKILNVE